MYKTWLSKGVLVKELTTRLRLSHGKSRGKIVLRHRRSPIFTVYHYIDRWHLIWNIAAVVVGFERSKSRRSYLALLAYPHGILTYVLATAGLAIGSRVMNGWSIPAELGNSLPLENIPLNIKISAIESHPGSGAVYARAPGAWAVISSKDEGAATLAFRSGVIKKFDLNCFATVGKISNVRWKSFRMKKAGHSKLFGRRPRVRGVAKNPVDHPHGGGKGKKSKNAVPEAPWGRLGKRKKK